MPSYSPPYNPMILNKMLTFNEFKGKSLIEIEREITRGMEMHEADQRLVESHNVMPSHYHLPISDKIAMSTAALYRIMVDVQKDRKAKKRKK